MSDVAVTSSWQIAAVVVAVISIVITIAIFLKNRKIKSLSYEILTNTRLLTLSEDLQGKIKIYYTREGKEEQIDDLSVIIAKVFNDGNEPIKADDYEKSLTISIGPKSRLISGEIIQVHPENLSPQLFYTISLEEPVRVTEAILKPILLNQNDSITLKLLLTGAADDIKFSARIVGVSDLKNKTTKESNIISSILSNTIWPILGIIILFIYIINWLV